MNWNTTFDWDQIEKQIYYFFVDPNTTEYADLCNVDHIDWGEVSNQFMQALVDHAITAQGEKLHRATDLVIAALWKSSRYLFDGGCDRDPEIFEILRPLFQKEAEAQPDGKISLQRVLNFWETTVEQVESTVEQVPMVDGEIDALEWVRTNEDMYVCILPINYLYQANREVFVNDTTENYVQIGELLEKNKIGEIEW